METKFKVGDLVWHARCDHLPVSAPCPICFTRREVTLILGNGDSVTLPCEYCGKGFNGSSGFVEEYAYVSAPESVHISGLELTMCGENQHVKYRDGTGCSYRLYEENDLFTDKEEAVARGQELKAALEAEQTRRADHIKKDKKKSFAWNAGYHLREAKRIREQIAYHEKMAVLCKAKQKEEPCQKPAV